MKKTFLVSDEMLNAFVDGELEGDDHEHIIKLEALHPEINKAISEKQRLKFLVKSARIPERPVTSSNIKHKCFNRNSLAIAASVMLTLVFLSVYLLPENNQLYPDSLVKYSPKSSYRNTSNLIQAARDDEVKKIIFHLKTSDNEDSVKLLNDVEALIVTARKNGHPPQIEVIATGQGINILTTKTKDSILNLIQSIHKQQPGITFIVCGLTLKKLQHDQDTGIVLLQKTMLVQSGKKWIQQRKKEGWSYMVI